MREDFFSLNPTEIPQGTGSGFVWDDQGHVVTNFHVIQEASAAKVTLADHSVWDARLVGCEPDKDLAVLKIDAPATAAPLPIGTSHDLEVGQKVFAIGNPFGLDQTLTTGVISGLGRQIRIGHQAADQRHDPDRRRHQPRQFRRTAAGQRRPADRREHRHLQPLRRLAGIGFAVPVDMVNRIVPQLLKDGRVTRPGLGVEIANDRDTALGIEGLLVRASRGRTGTACRRSSPRFTPQGEVELGDIIVGIDDDKIATNNDCTPHWTIARWATR